MKGTKFYITIIALLAADAAAIALCREGRVPVIVFSLSPLGNIRKAALGRRIGTSIGEK